MKSNFGLTLLAIALICSTYVLVDGLDTVRIYGQGFSSSVPSNVSNSSRTTNYAGDLNEYTQLKIDSAIALYVLPAGGGQEEIIEGKDIDVRYFYTSNLLQATYKVDGGTYLQFWREPISWGARPAK